MATAKTQRSTVVGVFQDRHHAQQAVSELRRAGFHDEQIGVAGRDYEATDKAAEISDKGTKAAAGAATGLAAGAGLGALWGMGIIAGLLPAIGPAIAGGTLAAILSSAAAGAAAASLVGALIGLGIPEEEAKFYDTEFQSGRTIVTVRADGRYDEALNILRKHQGYDYSLIGQRHAQATGSQTSGEASTAGTASTTSGAGQTIQAREEQLHVRKEPVEAGEVRVRKEVKTEHKTIDVPVTKEEVVIERRPVSGKSASSSTIKEGEEIRVPVKEEQVSVEKEAVVKEEVHVGKRKVQDTEKVSGTVRKEEIKVEKEGDVDVREKKR